MKLRLTCALLLLLFKITPLASQAWEEVYYENFGEGFTGQPLPSGWSENGWHGNVEGATGASNDPCQASLLTVTDPYLAYQMNLSDTYEYYVSMNLKTDDTAGAQLVFYYDTQAGASGTQIGNLVDVPIIPYTQPGQVVSSGTFSGLNGAYYFIIGKSPTDPSTGNERVRVDDFRLYRRPVGGINAPPSVSFTTPSDGASFSANTQINLSATATDSDGTIQSVQFYHGTTLVEEDFTAPYEASIAGGLAAGNYVLKAVATDDEGATNQTQISISVESTTGVGDSISVCSRIDRGSDDAEENGNIGEMLVDGNTLDLVYGTTGSGTSNQLVGLRFNNLNIPQGVTINSAYIQFTTYNTNNLGSDVLTIHGQSSDNPATFSNTDDNISSRPLTTANVNWSPNDWNTIGEAGAAQRTVDIAPIIQELVNRPGFSENSGIAIIITGSGRRTAKSFNNSSSEAPELCINYGTQSPSVTIITPTEGSVFTEGENIPLEATATDSDGTIQSVDFYYGSTLISSDSTAPYTALIGGGLAAGNYILKAVATDNDGDTSQAQISITVDPIVVLDSVTVCSRIDRGTDDAEENGNNGQMLVDGNILDLVNGQIGGETTDQLVGLRFNNLNIPQGATIRSAHIQFTVYNNNNIGSDELTIRGESSDNPATFSNISGSISTRSLTSASVGWSPANWNVSGEAGPLQKTVDIAPIIQELVDRPGFSESSGISIIITGSGRRTAKTYDNSSSEAPELCIVYGTSPPSVTLVTPTEGSVFTEGDNILLEATATDSDGTIQSVDFYYGSTLISSDPTAPYTATIAGGLTAGSYTLKAVATDDDGLTAESLINITVEPPNLGPSVNLDTPTEGSVFETGTLINLTATASDSDGTIQSVQFYHGTILVDEDFTAPYEAIISGGLAAGSYVLKAIAIDEDGATAESTINIVVEDPNVPPLVSINTPTNGAVFTEGQAVDFQAIASDSDGIIVQMDLYQGPTLLISNSPSSAPYITTYSINNLSPGTYTLRAVATDDDGAVSEETISIQIQSGTPAPQFSDDPITSLGKGDLIFLGFDNDIGNDRDRIIVTNLVGLQPNTSFMITTANYCGVDDRWYSLDSLDGYIPVQQITYVGDTVLPVGSVLCFDIPGDGDHLVTDFMIDGNLSADFEVDNIGQRAVPDVNLRKDSTAGHLFLLQGGSWRYHLDHATFSGRVVAPPIRYGADWDTNDCSTGSQLPGADQCIAGPSFPTTGGSVYAYFDCSIYGSQYSPFAFMKEAIDPSKWDIYNGTDTLDLSSTACGLDCEIVQDSIYWVSLPDTLRLDCVDNYQDSLDIWLSSFGNAAAASNCQDSVNLNVQFEGITTVACSVAGQDVVFVATDSCGGRITTLGNIQLDASTPLSFDQVARDTTIQCDPDSLLLIYGAWLADHGGARVSSNCLVSWDSTIVKTSSPCSLIDTVWATFHAISICGDTISTSAIFTTEDNEAPVFVTLPRDTTFSCHDLGRLKTWKDSAGGASITDNCTSGTLLDISSDFTHVDGQCGNTLVTFTVSDGCGNATTASATVTIVDDVPPYIEDWPDGHRISIDANNFQDSIYNWLEIKLPTIAKVADLCTTESDSLVWSHDYNNQLSQGQCDSVIVNLSIRDKCYNSVDTSLVIYAIDDFSPTFSRAPDTLLLTCDQSSVLFDLQISQWAATQGGATAVDKVGTVATITVSGIDSIQQRCGYYEVLFTATDDCGNSGSITGIVQVTDDFPPYFVGGGIEPLYLLYADTSNYSQISSWQEDNHSLRAGDNCTDELAWSSDNVILPDTSCVALPVVFYLDDGCNTTVDTSYLHIYLPLDTLSTGSDLSIVACDNGAAQNWLDSDAGIVVTTGCGESIAFDYQIISSGDCSSQDVIFSGVTPWGETLSFTKTLTTTDNTAPIFTQGPFDLTVNCGDAGAIDAVANWLDTYGNAEASDDCGGTITWYRNYESIPMACGNTTVLFTIEDACGNTHSEFATLTIEDQQAPSIITPASTLSIYLEPNDLNATGGSNPRIEGIIQNWLDNQGGAQALDTTYCLSQAVDAETVDTTTSIPTSNVQLSWTADYTPSNYAPMSCDSLLVTFTVKDACENPAQTQAYISIIDTINVPIIDTLPQPLVVSCADPNFQQIVDDWLGQFGYAHAYDPQGGSISWAHDNSKTIVATCSTDTLTFTATNECGLSSSYTVSYTVEDTEAPVISSPAGDIFVDSGWDVSTKTAAINSWLNSNGGASATDSCLGVITWSNDLDASAYTQNCGTIAVSFDVSDNCGNQSTTTGQLTLYQAGFDVDSAGNDLFLTCCAVDTLLLQNWLNEQAFSQIFTNCGNELNWSYSGYDPNAIAACIDQTITFIGSTPYGATYEFSRNIIFNSSACCDDLSLDVVLSGAPGLEQLVASKSNNCNSPLYSWYFNGNRVIDPDTLNVANLSYSTYGPGQYVVKVDCDGYACDTRDTLDLCVDFSVSLDCANQLIYHNSNHNCQHDMERKWFLDGQQIAAEGDYVTFDNFGTYSLEAICDSTCLSLASLSLACSDVQLELAASTDSIHATIIGCYPTTGTISWYIDNVEQSSSAGQRSIEKLGNGQYEARLTFSNNACVISETLDLCEEFSITIVESSGRLTVPTPQVSCYTSTTPDWYLAGSPPTYLGSGFEWIPTVDGIYTAIYNCDNICSASANYNWTSPCNDLAVEAIFVDDNFGRIDVSVTGADRCSQLLYNWYFRSGTGTPQLIEQDRTFPNYFPNNTYGTGYYSVEVRCQDGDTDCISTISDEVFYLYNVDCDYGVNITRSGNTLTANLTGDPCNFGAFSYVWEKVGGSLVGPFSNTLSIPSSSDAELYRVTISCGSYCEAYAEYLTVPCDLSVNLSNSGNQLCATIIGTSCNGETPIYVWRRNGYILQGATGPCYAPLSSGQYSVEVICGQDPSCSDLSSEQSFTYVDHCDLQLSISEDGNGQLCGNVSGSSCDGEVISYEWSKNGVVYSTNSCYTPTTNGFYQLTVSCDDGTTYCEEISYNSYQIGCDLSVSIQQSGKTLCALVFGNSCNGFPYTYTWYVDGVIAPLYTSSCITPIEDGVFTVAVDCGGCAATSPGYSFAVCGSKWISMTPTQASSVGDTVLLIKVHNFCGTPLISPQADSTGKIYNLVPIASDEYHLYVSGQGCYSLTTSDDCEGGISCPGIGTSYCYSSGSSLIRTDQPAAESLQATTNFQQLNIFPNPTLDEFNIAMHLNRETSLQMSMYDANGKIVLQEAVKLLQGHNQLNYKTQNLPEGVYIIRLQTKEELIYRKLMVIK